MSPSPSGRPDWAPETRVASVGEERDSRRVLMVRAAVLVGAFVFLGCIYSCRDMPSREEAPLVAFPGRIDSAPKIRMLVGRSLSAATLAVDGPFRIYDQNGAIVNNQNRRIGTTVTFDGRQLNLGAVAMKVEGSGIARMRICPEETGTLRVQQHYYPGDVEFIGLAGTSTLHCVVHMNIEEYLCGVLAGEVKVDAWHDEALKAQAVTSRTYAMFYRLRNADKAWDFGPTGRDAQQYRPGIVTNRRINTAVNLTSGQVLTWQNCVFPAYFHSSCGGHTLDSSRIFTSVPVRPLAGVECKWCTDQTLGNRYWSWKRDFTMATVAGRLERAGDSVPELKVLQNKGGIHALEEAERTPDGRITRFRVRVHLAPGSYEVWGNDVRLAIGPMELPSLNCKMQAAGKTLMFTGAGWGHGVGLCQFGSLGMARQGYNYQDILAHYFPYSRIVRMLYDPPETGALAGTGSATGAGPGAGAAPPSPPAKAPPAAPRPKG